VNTTKTLFLFIMVMGIWCLNPRSATADYETATAAYRNNDYRTAYRELLPLAQNGNAKAQALVAMMYKYGEAVDVNFEEAFNWYLASAKQGYPPAQYSLAELYESGIGTSADPDLALFWFTKAADAGLTRAKNRLQQDDSMYDSMNLTNKPEPWSRHWNFDLPDNTQPPDQPNTKEPAEPTGQIEPQVIAETKTPDAAPGIFRAQLGAMKSQANAQKLWLQISEPNTDLFEELQSIFIPPEPNSNRLHRVQTGPFRSMEAARHFCDVLMTRGIRSGCLPLKSIP
jgi:TPR repeat protein